MPALLCAAPVSPNIDRSIGFAARISPHVIPHSPISLLPFAHAANPGDGSAAAGLVAGGFHAPVGGPQPCQRMQRRCQRDFLAHGIDSSLEFHFAHRTLQCAGPTFCRQDRKRDRAEHRSSREFVVRRLGHGRFGGKIGPKSGRSSPRASQDRWFHRPMAATLGPACPMRARFDHESGEFACR